MKRSSAGMLVVVGVLQCALAVGPVAASGADAGNVGPVYTVPRDLNFQDTNRSDQASPLASVGKGAVGFGRNLFEDLSLQFQAPFNYAWHNPLRFAAGTIGVCALIATDHATQPALRDLSPGSRSDMQHISDLGAGRTGLFLAAGMGTLGLLTGSAREKGTSVMLAEALITSGFWTGTLKAMTGRPRPREMVLGESDWEGPNFMDEDRPPGATLLSFPSGHSTSAWATATILAHQYPTHGVVPALAYAGAAAVSYSRLVVNAHWLSDVVVGAVIGIGSARTVVSAHERRAAATRAAQQSLHFGVDVSPKYQGLNLEYRF